MTNKERDILKENPVLSKPNFQEQLKAWEEKEKKLKEANCLHGWQRRNVAINIAICEMQIKIRDKGR